MEFCFLLSGRVPISFLQAGNLYSRWNSLRGIWPFWLENLWLGDEFPRLLGRKCVSFFSFLAGSPRWSFSLWLEVPFLGDELPRLLG